ncbi:acyl-ACP--UDP-N-acetylglucosamine O-acyltransferase [Aquamicrobium sp. LC103]|uniref:acyl-ACP--UDP-N-acetylglucosamine O-acyltransferase n=1 Tax=Aquamicrobium sp. LC103 TaxID=1120658 RepID=UPI00063E8941|nr:acyl-ACP--UDP-N-acetylglucosamine O-acyltransferase [Aquamicrobium sp. LC103]TKT76970.1 acyl-ACP--UDP-N-acetylglucosamine O-acyltransferase [Aquamicrobium sp. LC103]
MTLETFVHPSAVVEPGAQLGEGVRIGPFCHVGPQVVLGDRVELVSHVSVAGATTVGEDGRVFPHAALGSPPQNHKHKGGHSTLIIGRNATIREYASLHLGTDTSRGETRVGDNAYLMAYTHVAHDCTLGNNVTMANYAALAGHVDVGDFANLGGFAGVHQFVRIGHHAFVAGSAGVVGDVIPYGMAFGNRARLRGLNVVGLRRSGMSRSDLATIRAAYKLLFSPDKPLAENAAQAAAKFADSPVVMDMVEFVSQRGKRHFTVPALLDPEEDDGGESD